MRANRERICLKSVGFDRLTKRRTNHTPLLLLSLSPRTCSGARLGNERAFILSPFFAVDMMLPSSSSSTSNAAPQRFYGGLAVALYGTTPSCPSTNVISIVDAVIDFSGNLCTVTCTTRACPVIVIDLHGVKDVRRVIQPDEGVAAIELDVQVFEMQSAVGPQWASYVLTIASVRADSGLVAALFTSAIHYQRRAAQMLPTGMPRMMLSPAVFGSAGQGSPGGVGRIGADVVAFSGFGARDAELAVIRQRRSERQRHLVGQMMLGLSASVAATSGIPMDSLLLATSHDDDASQRSRLLNGPLTTVQGHDDVSLMASGRTSKGMQPATAALIAQQQSAAASAAGLYDMHWCKWCSDFASTPLHERHCPNRPVECSWCGATMKSGQFDDHKYRCGDAVAQHAQQQQRREALAAARRGMDAPRQSTHVVEVAPAAASASSPSPPSTSAPESSSPPNVHGRVCIWCAKDFPKSHDSVCPEKSVMCKKCLEEVKLKDKNAHRLVCIRASGDDKASTVASSNAASAATTPRSGNKGVSFDVKE